MMVAYLTNQEVSVHCLVRYLKKEDWWQVPVVLVFKLKGQSLIMKMKTILFLFCEATFVSSHVSPSSACLIRKELYHEETQTCFTPLEQGPCMAGEWLVMGSVAGMWAVCRVVTIYHSIYPGTGVCRPQFVCKNGERPALDPAGGAVCDCKDGKEKFGGSCEVLYSQSVCRQSQVLLPDNFKIVHHNIWPGKFTCKCSSNWSAFKAMKTEVAPKLTNRRKEQPSLWQEDKINLLPGLQ